MKLYPKIVHASFSYVMMVLEVEASVGKYCLGFCLGWGKENGLCFKFHHLPSEISDKCFSLISQRCRSQNVSLQESVSKYKILVLVEFALT